MKNKSVLAVCGAGIATSSVIMLKVKELAELHKLDITVTKCQVGEYESKARSQHFDLIVSTTHLSDIGIPVVDGKPFLTGIGLEGIEQKIVQFLSGKSL
jgi:PTS system galactitol-specific IIB component